MKKQLLFSFFTLFLLTFIGHSQTTFFEGFENTTGPSAVPSTNWTLGSGNWHVFQNSVGLTERWKINNGIATPPLVRTGANAAYINREEIGNGNTSEDYLATPLISFAPNQILRFYNRTFTIGDQGTIYQIKVSTAISSPTDPTTYVTIAEFTEEQLSTIFNIYTEKVIEIPSSYIGQQGYIAFVKKQTQPDDAISGDRWLIDDVSLELICDTPTDLVITSLTANSLGLSWTENGTATSWEVLLQSCESAAPTETTTGIVYTGTLPYTFSSLQPETCYKLYVRSLCSSFPNSSEWSSAAIVTTPISAPCAVPTTLLASGVTHNSVQLSWTENDSETSWHVLAIPCGSPAPTATTGMYILANTNPFNLNGLIPDTCYSIYVRAACSPSNLSMWSDSDSITTLLNPPSCGGTFTDNGGTSSNYSNNSNQTYTICPTTPGEVVFVAFTSFDTESEKDALYVFNGNSSSSPQIASSNSGGSVPGGLAGGYWGTTIPGPFMSSSPDGCLTFRFRSNTSTTRPGWIANINCMPMDFCMQPSQVTLTNITDTSVTLNWVDYNASTAWHILALPLGSPQPTATTTGWITATTSSFVLTGLTPNTCYDFYVRSSCNANDTSVWSAPVTNCIYDCEDYGTCSDSIMTVAFIDSNANGIKDITESYFNYGYFNYTINNGPTISSFSNNGDYYIPSTNPANSYDLGYFIPSYLTPFYSTSASYQNITIVAGSGINYYYFPITEIAPYLDVQTYLYAISPRPGFTRNCTLYYRNNSTTTTTNGTVAFIKNNLETINSISQSGTNATTNGFTYNYTNLAPQESRTITINLQTPTIPIVNLGDLLNISSHISNIPGEVNLVNNNNVLTKTVVGSYDPNEVYESHGPEIPINNFTSSDYLNYTITFENTGTANAEFIRIENLLSNKLNPSTIEMIGSSHNYDLKRENNKLTWFFYDIDLPPTSQNSILSHGFVSYRIKPNPGYAIGDIIPNTASIFFDYNPPIITNTFNTEFVAPLNNLDFNSGNFIVYPNPTNGLVQISLKNNSDTIQTVTIFDVLGKVVKKVEAVNSNQTNINVSELSSGIYMVEVTTENNLKQVKKLVIK